MRNIKDHEKNLGKIKSLVTRIKCFGVREMKETCFEKLETRIRIKRYERSSDQQKVKHGDMMNRRI